MANDQRKSPPELASPSRRSFLTGAAGLGIAAVGAGGVVVAVRESEKEPTPEQLRAPDAALISNITLRVNNKSIDVSVPDHRAARARCSRTASRSTPA
jgi:hypothetical protein